ncbi:helix-turn-helix domain-containing protein [Paenibacillus sp. NEAU-GSW1]|uniref:helix-turn-helix domain-containing protein n=1 Tax=Paenibacillus sp. NEAU-GSW1 TaxID=2682486 RepID=UPI0012E128B1|nr:helix-turn-helix domain-containing protein [Paenibacillus sp. NEAU-GSW1]MUT68296.1 helix-turn-helix domain-containing protein [Paenibacillus sp. NEAU-GSW1]
MNTLSELAVFGRMLYAVLQLPVFVVHPERKIESEYAAHSLRSNPYFAAIREQLAGYAYSMYAPDKPGHFSRTGLQYGFVNAWEEGRFVGTIVVGPYLHEALRDGQWSETMETIHAGNRGRLLELYEAVPLLDPERARAVSLMIHYAIRRQLVDPSANLQIEGLPLPQPDTDQPEPDAELSRSRRSGMLHTNLSHERVLLHYIRSGKKEQLRTFVMESIIGEDEFGVLAKGSRLRSEKNLMITGIALICRAAIEGGMHEEDAFVLSDFYIQQLEEKGDLHAVVAVMMEAMFDFVDRVAEVRRGHYSPAVQDCLREIANRLYSDVTLDGLAERINLSPSYLSSLFKKEVGLTFSDYVQRERVEEAKNLLALTDDSITDIAAWLNFNDQSYFNKVFKKWQGITPKAYRHAERRPAQKKIEPDRE